MNQESELRLPVSSRLRLLSEIVKTVATGVDGFGPQPTLMIRRTRRKCRKRRIDPVDLIANPTVPYATGFFAAPCEIVRP